MLSALRRKSDRLWLAFFPGGSGEGGRYGNPGRFGGAARCEGEECSFERLTGRVELFDFVSGICTVTTSSTMAEW